MPDPPPLHRPAQHALEHDQRPVDGRLPHSVRFQFGPVALDDLWRDRAEPHQAEPGQHVPIPEPRVAAQRPGREVRHRVDLPPLFGELGESFAPAIEQVKVAGSLAPHDLRVEGLGVALATDHLRPRPPLLVAPAHPPDRAALPFDPFNAHSRPPPVPSSSNARRLPRLPVTGKRGVAGTEASAATIRSPTHRSSSAG
jgi:hypothetical protein